MKRNLTCIVCPMGCQMVAEIENGEVVSVTGNTCPRGKKYAIDECIHPMRTVTSTVRTERGDVVAVKTDAPIPKELMLACMKVLEDVRVKLPVHIGDVVIGGVLGTEANVVITANLE